MTKRETEYRNALMWAFDRLTTDGITPNEIRTTVREIGNVLMGRPSSAGRHVCTLSRSVNCPVALALNHEQNGDKP